MDDDFEVFADRVNADHYLHWFAVIAATVWAGTIYGWLAGVGTFLGLLIAISLTNTIIITKTGNLRATRFSRWGWVMLAFLIIIISSAEIGTVQP